MFLTMVFIVMKLMYPGITLPARFSFTLAHQSKNSSVFAARRLGIAAEVFEFCATQTHIVNDGITACCVATPCHTSLAE